MTTSSRVTISVVALGSVLAAHCAPDCPDGMSRKLDQCVREEPEGPDADSSGGSSGAKGTGKTGGTGGAATAGGSGGRTSDGGADGSGNPGAGGGGAGGLETGSAGARDTGGAGGNAERDDGGLPDAGDAGTDADVEPPCEPGFVWSTDSCLPLRIYVSTTGDDANDGSPGHPLRSFGAAMKKARPRQHVLFESGTWSAETTGDTFAESIPAGIEVENASTGHSFMFVGGGTAALTFGGTAVLRGVTIAGFQRPVVALSGDPVVENVIIRDSMGSAVIGGTAHLTCMSCTFEEDTSKRMSILLLQDSARLDLADARFTRFLEFASAGVEVKDAASLYATGCNFGGAIQNAVLAYTTGTVSLMDSSFSTGNYEVFAGGVPGKPAARVAIVRSTFVGGVQLVGPIDELRVRGSTMGFLTLWASNQVADLGMPEAPGGNRFERSVEFSAPYLSVTGWGNVVHAVGNQWPANEQGADAQGYYPSPVTIHQGESGTNIEVRAFETDGGGLPPSRVEL